MAQARQLHPAVFPGGHRGPSSSIQNRPFTRALRAAIVHFSSYSGGQLSQLTAQNPIDDLLLSVVLTSPYRLAAFSVYRIPASAGTTVLRGAWKRLSIFYYTPLYPY